MEGTEKFCLRWNDFEANISEGFRELREEKDFFDVTLACEDNQIQAHRVIISACSPFFRNVLRRNPHQHPLLYLKGVKYRDLLSILNFMYMGEVNVAQEELNSFLAVAEDLRVKGLTQNNSDSSNHKQDLSKQVNRQKVSQGGVSLPPQTKRPRVTSPSAPSLAKSAATNWQKDTEDEIQEVAAVKTETFEPQVQPTTFHQPLSSEQAQTNTENQNTNSVALDDGYAVDDSFEYHYEDTAAYDSLAGINVNVAVAEGNKGTKKQPKSKISPTPGNKSNKQSSNQPTKPRQVTTAATKPSQVTSAASKPSQVTPAASKPRQVTTTATKPKEKRKPSHSYKRFGSAWQCELCKTLFSRQSYAMEHMEEEEAKREN